MKQYNASEMVIGFFGGCYVMDALLASTLDCLYNNSCLERFPNYFPSLNKVYIKQFYFIIII